MGEPCHLLSSEKEKRNVIWYLKDTKRGKEHSGLLRKPSLVGCSYIVLVSNAKCFGLTCGVCAGGHYQVDNELLSLQQRHTMEEVAAKHDGPTKMTNSPTKKGTLPSVAFLPCPGHLCDG